MSNAKQPKSRKVLWVLLALGLLVINAIFLVIGLSVFRKKSTAIVPIVLSHEVTSEESRWKWGPEVPHGTQVLDNVTFVVDGGLRVAGLATPKHPGALLGIPIRRKGAIIHLLQAAENVNDRDRASLGTIYGRLQFHFANGQSRDMFLRYGIHGFDWWQTPKQLTINTVSDPNTTVAWVAAKPGGNISIRLYHTALKNPFPNEEITSFDAISPLAQGNLLLLAVSIGNGETKLQPALEEAWPSELMTLAFSLKDGDGKPIPSGFVRWEAAVPLGTVYFPAFPCDASGQMSIEFATHAITRIRYSARGQEGATAEGAITMLRTSESSTQEIAVVFAKKLP